LPASHIPSLIVNHSSLNLLIIKKMLVKKIMLLSCVFLLTMASCSKDKDTKSNEVPLEGLWVGKYSFLSEPYNQFYSFKFNAAGALEVWDNAQQKIGEGTWAFNGVPLTGTYTLLPPNTGTFSFIATFDNQAGKLTGTWGTGQQEYGGGYWFMNRVN
jgi:hypothetical protein